MRTPSSADPVRPRPAKPPRRALRARKPPLEQLALELAPSASRWTFSRRIVRTRHHRRILERLEFVRRFFPELDAVSIHVGQALKPGVLGWGSMDPERPGIWVRPIRLATFTIAHEFIHLLQARGLAPQGERSCDLWALARSPLIIDCPPSYLALPRALRARKTIDAPTASLLCRMAREAIERRERGDRRYLARFEREFAAEWAGRRVAAAPVRRVPIERMRLALEG